MKDRIDSALDRLPSWEPPADFAARLAAAAARQHSQPVRSSSLVHAGYVLRLLSDSALIVLGSLAVGSLMGWAPWAGLVGAAEMLGWASAIVFGITGLWMMRRNWT